MGSLEIHCLARGNVDFPIFSVFTICHGKDKGRNFPLNHFLGKWNFGHREKTWLLPASILPVPARLLVVSDSLARLLKRRRIIHRCNSKGAISN